MTGTKPDITVPATQLHNLLNGAGVVQAISVAATLGIPDLLDTGPKQCDELAGATGTHQPSLYRLLRALAAAGVLVEHDNATFALAPMGELLRSNCVGSAHAMAVMRGSHWEWAAWEGLCHSVKTGKTAFDHVFGQGLFDYLDEHPHDLATFNAMMTFVNTAKTLAVPNAYDFSNFGTIVDVGGGRGTFIASILTEYPHVQGLLFDQPAVVAEARTYLQAAQVADRCEVKGGDFFASIPAGGDAYVLRSILHNWDDEHASAILRNCRSAMNRQARLLIIELMVPDNNAPHPSKLIDLQMLVLFGGRERTQQEFSGLFDRTGFELTDALSTSDGFSIIEGIPAPI